MASKYYYFVATLPYLKFDHLIPFSVEDFRSKCEGALSQTDFMTIKNLDKEDRMIKDCDSEAVKKWKLFNQNLKELIASKRSGKERASGKETPHLLRKIIESANPLEREKVMEKMRWDFLENEEYAFHFDMSYVTYYYIKLGILERLSNFDGQKGSKIFEIASASGLAMTGVKNA